jgi:uncharacterized protein (TIGR03083 family)
MSRTALPREPLVEALTAVWSAVETLATATTDEQWRRASILPGWTVGDVVAHVMTTERMLLGDPVPDVAADVEAFDHVCNSIGAINERWLEFYRTRDRATVLADYRDVIARRTAALAAMAQEDFDADSFTPAGPDTYGRFMRIRVFDCWMHQLDLCDTLGVELVVDPIPIVAAMYEIFASMPYVVGKKAGAPDGCRVRFVIEGPVPRTLNIAVDGRAGIVRELDRDPDLTLTFNYTEFARLAGGRATGSQGAVVISGDRELGEKVLADLAFVM